MDSPLSLHSSGRAEADMSLTAAMWSPSSTSSFALDSHMTAPSPASLWSDCSALLLSPLPADDAMIHDQYVQTDLTPKAPARKRAQKGAVPRAQQNRISAQRVRDRQRQHEQELATKGDLLERENADLEMQLELLQCGHSQALQELAQLKASLALSASLLLAEAPTDTESSYSYSDDTSTIGSPGSAHHLDVPSSPDSTTTPYNQLHDMDSPGSPHSTIMAAAAAQQLPSTDVTSSDNAHTPSSGTALASLAGNSSNGEDSSCESAVLADGPSWPHPPQQDVLTFVIYLQLMMRTTLNWASTLALMKTLSTLQPSSRRSIGFPSSAATSALSGAGSSCASRARISQNDVRQAWQPSLAVT